MHDFSHRLQGEIETGRTTILTNLNSFKKRSIDVYVMSDDD